jgi:hypothetical protein
MAGCRDNVGIQRDISTSKCFCGQRIHASDPRCYFAWGCFRYFGWKREPRGFAAGIVACRVVARGQRPPSPEWASARQPSLASRAKAGGPGRTRTCNQTVMSGGITIGFVDVAVFLSLFDRVRCASVGSFLVRNWCGRACSCRRVGIDIYRSLSPNSFQDDHRAERLGPLKAETGVRFPFWRTITTSAIWPVRISDLVNGAGLPFDLGKQISAMHALMFGQPNFFAPRKTTDWWFGHTPTSYYDTSSLKSTLERLVDFDRINSREIRFSVGAVNVRRGNFAYFDNAQIEIRPEHVLASGALPPGFPSVEIDGEHYWDGGLVSNTPLQYVIEYCRVVVISSSRWTSSQPAAPCPGI